MQNSRIFTFQSEGRVPNEISMVIRDAVFAAKGQRLTLTLAKAKKYSSDKQCKYYFGIIVPAWMKILAQANDEYWSDEETHDYLMEEIGGWFKPKKRGQNRPIRRSYRDLSTQETEDHHMLCIKAAAEEHIIIPLPNEEIHMQNKQASLSDLADREMPAGALQKQGE